MKDILYEQVLDGASYLKSKIPGFNAKIGMVLGSGLGNIGNGLDNKIEIPYKDIPGFPVSTVEGHKGAFLYGLLEGVPVLLMSGRFHYYEGYTMQQVTMPIRIMKLLGIDTVIITNASGGINPHIDEGDIVIITDHINMMPEHPLRGKNEARFGVRFPDMMDCYDKELIEEAQTQGSKLGLNLKTGVYIGLQGPSLETKAEYKMCHILGADLVGMSSVPEVIVARHMDMRVLAISIVANVSYPPDRITVTTHEEVLAVVSRTSVHLETLIRQLVRRM